MAKIPFTLEAWLKDKSQKVVDEDGRPVRIICTDADGLYPIIGLVDNKTPLPCGKDGRPPYIGGGGGVLFIVTPEEEMTEFEKKLWEVLKSEGSPIGPIEKFTNADKEAFHSYAAELLDLAKDEIYSHKSLVEYSRVSREQGKAEAMKDLPRWKTIKKEDNAIVGIPHFGTNMIGEKMLYIREKAISISSLMKLPGFKED